MANIDTILLDLLEAVREEQRKEAEILRNLTGELERFARARREMFNTFSEFWSSTPAGANIREPMKNVDEVYYELTGRARN